MKPFGSMILCLSVFIVSMMREDVAGQKAQLHYFIGFNLQKGAKVDMAVSEYKRSIEIQSNAPALIALSGILSMQGHNDESLNYLNQAYALGMNNVEYHIKAGGLLMGIKKPLEAIAHYEKGLSLDPEIEQIRILYFNLGAAYYAASQDSRAVKSFQKYVEVETAPLLKARARQILHQVAATPSK